MEKYKYAGQTLKVRDGAGKGLVGGVLDGKEFIAEDYWINLPGNVSWMFSDGNPACLEYAFRTGLNREYGVPEDDNVVYGHIDGFGHLFHETELIKEDLKGDKK